MQNLLEVQSLAVTYQGKKALDDVQLTLHGGTITGIIGPNGAGKSTFLKGLLGLIKTKKRLVLWNQEPLDAHKKHIAYVEQRSALDLSFPISVLEVVLLGTYPALGWGRRPKAEQRAQALAALKTVQMEAFAQRQIGELSGGQLQRVFIARVLAQSADIILLDEPFVGIDMTSEKVIMDVLHELKAAGKLILIVHHDLHKVSSCFDEIILLKNRLIAQGPTSKTFTTNNLEQAYGDSMGDLFLERRHAE